MASAFGGQGRGAVCPPMPLVFNQWHPPRGYLCREEALEVFSLWESKDVVAAVDVDDLARGGAAVV